MGALDVAGLRPLAAGLVERGACGGETLPQRVGLRLVDVHGRALMLLPLVEQGTELVGGGTPVDLVIQRGCEGLGLLDDLGAFFDSLGDRRLAGLVSSAFFAAPASFSCSNCCFSAAMSPTAAGLSVSCSRDFSVSSISCDFTVSECRRLASRSNLALRSR